MQSLRSQLRFFSGALHDARIRIPFLFFLAVMLMLSLQRLAISTALNERFSCLSTEIRARSFVVGLRYDLVMACSLSVPLFVLLLFAWPRLLASRWLRITAAGYCSVAISLTLFLCIADFFFFKEFDQRLDFKAIEYLEYDYVYKIIWDDFPVIPIFLIVAGAFAGSCCFFLRVGFSRPGRFSPLRVIAWPCVVIPLLVLGIRGSLGPKAINNGPAYFSNSMSLAQLTLNGLFTLREAIDCLVFRNDVLSDCVRLLPEEEALSLTTRAVLRNGDLSLNDQENPLRRITDTGKPRTDYNVVLVILESLSWHYIGIMGGNLRLTPNLDELAAHGVLMDRCFAVGSRTPFGFSGTICSFPDLAGQSVTKRSKAEGNFFTLGHVLRRRGYETMFIYGGDSLYDHRQAFLRSNGFTRFVFKGDFDSPTFSTHLGWCDEDLFFQADKEFRSMGEQPFLAVLLTVSFHRPYKVPEGRCVPIDPKEKDSEQLTCVRYTDWAVGQFIKRARESDYFDRTIFVFVADHTGGASGNPISPVSYRIPFLLYAPSILGDHGRRVSNVCSQTDVAPTIMSILGGRFRHCFFGSSVLDRPAGNGLALMQHSSKAIALMNGDQEVVIVPCGGEPRIFRYGAPDQLVPLDRGDPKVDSRRDHMRRQAIAMFETAEILFQRGAYNIKY